MSTIIKIKPIGLTKMNNPEYEAFMARFRKLISDASPDSAGNEGGEGGDSPQEGGNSNPLGITPGQLAAFDADFALIVDLVNQSRVSDETEQMLNVDKWRDELVVFFTSMIALMATSPLPEQRSAATTIKNRIKSYVGIYKSANQQETAEIDGLLTDLAKPGMPELIETLGLTKLVTDLRAANTEYATLTAQRTNNKAATIKENSAVVRKRMDDLYDEMTTIAFVTSVAAPTEATATFVKNLNALIAETSALYNQRMAAARAAKNKK